MSAIALEPLIAEAKHRARRRRLLVLAAAGLIAAGLLAFELAPAGTRGGAHGAIPWLPTKPNSGPANPALAPACTASDLRASLFLQGATMSLAGPIWIVNRSSRPCSLLGRPQLSFPGETAAWRETRLQGAVDQFDPLAPPRGSLRALTPGEHVSVQLTWSNWCGPDPSAMIFAAPGGGSIPLRNELNKNLVAPVCNPAGGVSMLQAGAFTPFVPQGGRSTALPLKARIVPGSSFVYGDKTIRQPALVTRTGDWLNFTVVLTNTSRKPFHFGRTCPAYVEGVGNENQAHVLNCHAVGVMAPTQSVRFAMSVRLPAHVNDAVPAIGWALAPHSWNAPQALAPVRIPHGVEPLRKTVTIHIA
jgi:hypothetical protein